MSHLRIMGLVIALVFLAMGVRGLRSERDDSILPISFILTSIGVGLVAWFPEVSGVVNDILAIGRFTGSRLITLLILAVLALWVLSIVIASRVSRLNRQFDRYLRREVVNQFVAQNTVRLASSVLCIIPAYNEANNLKQLLPRFPTIVDGTPVNVLVVSDGSSDQTCAVAESNDALVAHVPVNRGGGAALRTGFDIATRTRVQAVVTIDGDGQNDPEDIAELVRPVLNSTADVIIGSRILGAHEITHWWRHVGVILFSHLINMLMGTRITDCSSGFRAIRTSVLPQLRLFQDQYHTSEFIILTAKKGLRIAERPIVFRRRISGKSKKGPELLYGFRFLYVLTTTWLRSQ